MTSRRLKPIHGVVLLCLIVLFFTTRPGQAQRDGLLRIYFLSVGQGDSELIEAPDGTQVLIDGGPDDAVLSELAKAIPFYDHDIDLVVVTHPHSDHISGLIDVLDRYAVSTVIEAAEIYDSPQFRAWEEAVAAEGARHIEAAAGQVFKLGSDATLTVLYPMKSYAGVTLDAPHEANVTTMLQYKQFRALFTGDMEAKGEKDLISAGDDLKADVLKIGHHGSATSSSQAFLDAVQPQIGIIEAGKNNIYHLPNQGVLDRYQADGIPIHRTDREGTMEIISDGRQFQFLTGL
ncbi:MAG TPA: ComEC/Rec2 family competence protein [Candidatus Paceibacterota bacterium]|nr:ComEC/Rec2 family competence protein [Candidatus Paceibacterota bacterium]